jgi:iron(III) transport system permease protein
MNWSLLQNSLLVAGFTSALALALGFMAALWLAAVQRRWRSMGLVLAIVAMAMPPFLVTNCWLDLLGTTGVWRGWLPLNIFSLPGAVWILALLLWPITTFTVWSRWERLEPELLEVEPALRGTKLIRHLLLPAARTPLLLAGALTLVLALNNFAVPAILQVKVFPAEMWVSFSSNFDSLAALKLSLVLVAAPLLLLTLFARTDVSWPTLRGKLTAHVFHRQLGRGWFGAATVVTFAAGTLSVGVPVLELALTSRTWVELPGAIEAGQSALWNSVWLSAATATMCVTVALAFGARALARFNVGRTTTSRNASRPGMATVKRPEGRAPLQLVAWLPFLIPGVLIGIAFIWLFNRPATGWFYSSFGVVLLAFVVRYFALGSSLARHALQTTDRDLHDAAQLDGATRWQMLRLVQWPQIAPQVAAAWYAIYLLCLWDVESLVLIVPPGGETLALRIFNLLHYGHNAQVNALCLTLLGAAVAPLLVVAAFVRARHFIRSRAEGSIGRVLTNAATIAIMLALFSGCSPAASKQNAPLHSRFFEHAEVIATRGVGVGEVNKPRSLAMDHDDNLYVADMTGRIQKFSPDGKPLRSWQMPNTGLGKPKGMGCDNDGNVIVVEPHYKRVNHFAPDATLMAQWGVVGTNLGELAMPRSVAVNSQREIFLSEYGQVERVQKFRLPLTTNAEPTPNPSQEGSRQLDARANEVPLLGGVRGGFPSNGTNTPGRRPALRPLTLDLHLTDAEALAQARPTQAELLLCFGHLGGAPGEFNRAEGICVDKQDRLYVADSCNHRVQVFTSDGKFIREFGRPGNGPGELSYPYDVKVDAQGNIFVCEFGNSRIQVFDDNGRSLEIIGGAGAKPGQFNNPWSIALDSHGNLYVADALNHRVQKLVRRDKAAASMNTRSVLPHPCPLPPGEGETFPAAPEGNVLCYPQNLQSFTAMCYVVPSPWGEGQGEGGREQTVFGFRAPRSALRVSL